MTSRFFEELDHRRTSLGELVLRRRRSPSVADLVYEVRLDDEMLMSSSVNESERALATLALEPRKDRPLDVLVGGLGLGHTAAAVLEYSNVERLVVVELLAPVIDWHRNRLVPLAGPLMEDARCSLVEGDFFEHVAAAGKDRVYDAILLDIDHAPDCPLLARNVDFYTPAGMRAMTGHLHPGGVFALWSAWKVPDEVLDAIRSVFPTVQEHEISFLNPHGGEMDSNRVVTAERHEVLREE